MTEYSPFMHVSGDKRFFLSNGVVLRNVADLTHALKHMSHNEFHEHVSEHKHDFAAWVAGVFHNTDLAKTMKEQRSQQQLASVLDAHLDAHTSQAIARELPGTAIEVQSVARTHPDQDVVALRTENTQLKRQLSELQEKIGVFERRIAELTAAQSSSIVTTGALTPFSNFPVMSTDAVQEDEQDDASQSSFLVEEKIELDEIEHEFEAAAQDETEGCDEEESGESEEQALINMNSQEIPQESQQVVQNQAEDSGEDVEDYSAMFKEDHVPLGSWLKSVVKKPFTFVKKTQPEDVDQDVIDRILEKAKHHRR